MENSEEILSTKAYPFERCQIVTWLMISVMHSGHPKRFLRDLISPIVGLNGNMGNYPAYLTQFLNN